MKFTYKDKVRVKKGFHTGREYIVKDASLLGFLLLCSNEKYGQNDFHADMFWSWQLEKVKK